MWVAALRVANAFSISSSAATVGRPSNPTPATLLNGDPGSAKLATPPAIEVTKPAPAGLRRRAARLVAAMRPASACSMRLASVSSQKRDVPGAFTTGTSASYRGAHLGGATERVGIDARQRGVLATEAGRPTPLVGAPEGMRRPVNPLSCSNASR